MTWYLELTFFLEEDAREEFSRNLDKIRYFTGKQ